MLPKENLVLLGSRLALASSNVFLEMKVKLGRGDKLLLKSNILKARECWQQLGFPWPSFLGGFCR